MCALCKSYNHESALSIVGDSKPERSQGIVEFAMTDDDEARGYDGEPTDAKE